MTSFINASISSMIFGDCEAIQEAANQTKDRVADKPDIFLSNLFEWNTLGSTQKILVQFVYNNQCLYVHYLMSNIRIYMQQYILIPTWRSWRSKTILKHFYTIVTRPLSEYFGLLTQSIYSTIDITGISSCVGRLHPLLGTRLFIDMIVSMVVRWDSKLVLCTENQCS